MTDDIDEIERLKGHVANLQDIAGKQNAEIERLKEERDDSDMVPREFNEANIRVAREWKARAEAAEKERDKWYEANTANVAYANQQYARAEAAEAERDKYKQAYEEALPFLHVHGFLP